MGSIAQSSWILGVTSIILALASVVGIVFVIRKRVLAAWGILGLCIVVFATLAIVFRPI